MFIFLVPTVRNSIADFRPSDASSVVAGERSGLARATDFIVIAIVDAIASLNQFYAFAVSASVLANTCAIASGLVASVSAIVMSVASLTHRQAFARGILWIAAEMTDVVADL